MESILSQIDETFEVLLINDGSNDRSEDIIDSYAKKYPGIVRVISKKNEGTAKTRNLGIREARGEFIFFIDNDDFVDDGYFKRFINAIDEKSDIVVENKPCLKGSVLHIDGDKDYLKMCLDKYKEFNITVYGYYMEESEIKDKIIPLLEKHRPDLLVITGHDAMKKNSDRKNINSYLHTKDFVEAIRKARLYQDDKDSLIIFAGACQSYYELLLASGANFASSPSRKNIHALDPVFIVSQIANASIKNYVDLEKIVAKTSNKHLGIGGIDTRGVARKIYPTSR